MDETTARINYIDVTYTVHLSTGETQVFTVKTYPCPQCNTPMLLGPISYPGTGDKMVASYHCPNDGIENVRIVEVGTDGIMSLSRPEQTKQA